MAAVARARTKARAGWAWSVGYDVLACGEP
jgi:hypothetical protein